MSTSRSLWDLNSSRLYISSQKTFSSSSVIGFTSLRDRSSASKARLASSFVGTASTVGEKLDLDWFESAPYFVGYFLLTQLALVPMIYCFTRIDWHAALAEKRLKWLGSQSKQ